MEGEPQGGQICGGPAQSQEREIDERRIRERAHEIWVEEGKPEGRALHHWLRAKWELEQAPDPKEEIAQLERDYEAAGKRE